MSKLNTLLSRRFRSEKKEKMTKLVERSNSGQLSSFAGVFQITPIDEREKALLLQLLKTYQTGNTSPSNDLSKLATLTSEVKAISHQAVVLHGERIKQIQLLLKQYKEGAFSAYLLEIYGNRQTPYNFLLYYELYSKASQSEQKLISEMPRQVIYSLSSRKVPQEKKVAFIKAYQGETKEALLQKLRQAFPLPLKDKRKVNPTKQALSLLSQAAKTLALKSFSPSENERKALKKAIAQIERHLL